MDVENIDDFFDWGDVSLSPAEFEAEVAKLIRKQGIGLASFEVKRLEVISGADGAYEIDITARFEALSASFLVLIECKQHKNPIKREVVQILHDKLRAVGGHKGMIFSTARFQRGAIEYAQSHGIALVRIVDRRIYILHSRIGDHPCYEGWIISLNEDGKKHYYKMFGEEPKRLLERFKLRAT
jgi:restriction system protein